MSRDDKYRAKYAIDTFVFRFGDTGAAWINLGLVALGIGGGAIALMAVLLTIRWLMFSLQLGSDFRRGLLNKELS